MRILLIGGTGFLGSAVSDKLKSRGHTVLSTGLTRKGDLKLNLLDVSGVKSVVNTADWDAIINFAAVLTPIATNPQTMEKWETGYKVNAQGPRILAEAVALGRSNPLIVHIASATEPDSASPIPESRYSETKSEGTHQFRQAVSKYELKAKVAVVHNVYGLGQDNRRFLASAIENLQKNKTVHVQYPFRVRDFCLRREVAHAIGSLVDGEGPGLVATKPAHVEIGTGVGVTLADAVRTVAKLLGADESLITYGNELRHDVHPVRIANVDPTGFKICKTLFQDGIQRVISERE